MIPSLGRPELSHTLHSIRKQTDDDFETIVVYDGIDIENKEDDKNVFFINIHKSSKGAGPVRNAAIPFITTEWTAFVDDDATSDTATGEIATVSDSKAFAILEGRF